MKFVFALILMTYSLPSVAQIEWSCQVGESQLSFKLQEEGLLTMTEANTSISATPQTRTFAIDPLETGSTELESSVSFRNQDPEDAVYGDQIVLFSTVDGEWSSFYYAYVTADDPDGYIYEYDFYFESDCELGEEKLKLASVLGKLSLEKE